MRGHCQYGKQGQACAFAHPPMCYKFLRNGSSSCCTKGSNSNYTHPKMCQASLATGYCMRRNCRYYHKSGTNRPTMKTENMLNPSHRVSYSNRATPLMDLNLPNPQPSPDNLYKASYSTFGIFSAYTILYSTHLPGSVIELHNHHLLSYTTTIYQSNTHLLFLEQMNALMQLMSKMHQAQTQLILTMSQTWLLITPQLRQSPYPICTVFFLHFPKYLSSKTKLK